MTTAKWNFFHEGGWANFWLVGGPNFIMRHPAPIDLWVKTYKTLWSTSDGWGYPLAIGPKLVVGEPKIR